MEVSKEWLNRMHFGDCIKSLEKMPAKFVNTCVTSPPYYGLRDYGSGKWIGGDPAHAHEQHIKKTRDTPTKAVHCDVQQLEVRKRKSIGRNDVDRKYGANSAAVEMLTKKELNGHGAQCECGAVFVDEQIGIEETPEAYVSNMVNVFRAVHRVLRDDGTVWLNLGDSYSSGTRTTQTAPNIGRSTPSRAPPLSGIKPKDLIGIPWMVAFALRADGWYLRSDIIWHKLSVMPESIKDRCTKSHEHIFMLAKSEKYYFDMEAIMEPAVSAGTYSMPGGGLNGKGGRAGAMGRAPSGNEIPGTKFLNKDLRHKRDVWTVNPRPYSGAHFATYPEELIEPCILAGSPVRGVILDPFMGSGTTAAVAARLERYWVGCELNATNHFLQLERLGRTWLYEGEPTSPRQRVRLDGEGVRVRL